VKSSHAFERQLEVDDVKIYTSPLTVFRDVNGRARIRFWEEWPAVICAQNLTPVTRFENRTVRRDWTSVSRLQLSTFVRNDALLIDERAARQSEAASHRR